MKDINKRYLFFSYAVVFVLFVNMFPNNTIIGLERIVATYIIILLLTYAVSLKWRESAILALGVTLFLGLLDPRGAFRDYKYIGVTANETAQHKADVQRYFETFDVKPGGEGTAAKEYSEATTQAKDDTDFNDEDLDTLLRKDEDNGDNEKEHFGKAGGLDELKSLLDMAKKESPYADNKETDSYTPAEAQRETFRLINTVKQLKETMDGMMPTMKAGASLIEMYKKMGGTKLTSAAKN